MPLKNSIPSQAVAVVCLTASCHAGLLGAGTGEGSCAAAPFRAPAVKWALGCPEHAPCCSEYGYCRGHEEWVEGGFRYGIILGQISVKTPNPKCRLFLTIDQ